MGLSRRQFRKEFKLAAVRRLEQGVSSAEVSRGLEVNPSVLQRWRKEFRAGTGNAFPGNGKARWSEGRVAELERKIGQEALEIDFLKGCLHRIVYRLMCEDNLLCVRKRKFMPTTNSNHGRKVYPNLAADIVLTGTDQLWRADLTYIRLREEFVFLAVILDAYSRRVVGWALARTMGEELTLSALRMALSRRVVEPGLVHHSDRGSQYASSHYTDLLKET